MFAPFLYVLHAVAVKKSFDGRVSNDFILLSIIAFIIEDYSLPNRLVDRNDRIIPDVCSVESEIGNA